jgi:hypothetical protein
MPLARRLPGCRAEHDAAEQYEQKHLDEPHTGRPIVTVALNAAANQRKHQQAKNQESCYSPFPRLKKPPYDKDEDNKQSRVADSLRALAGRAWIGASARDAGDRMPASPFGP